MLHVQGGDGRDDDVSETNGRCRVYVVPVAAVIIQQRNNRAPFLSNTEITYVSVLLETTTDRPYLYVS